MNNSTDFAATADRDNLAALILGTASGAQDSSVTGLPGIHDLQIQDLDNPVGGVIAGTFCW